MTKNISLIIAGNCRNLGPRTDPEIITKNAPFKSYQNDVIKNHQCVKDGIRFLKRSWDQYEEAETFMIKGAAMLLITKESRLGNNFANLVSWPTAFFHAAHMIE
jgi:hypothetical protein